MRAGSEFTIGRVYRQLPTVLGKESMSLWLNFGLFLTAVNFLEIALQRMSGGAGFARGPVALAFFVFSFAATGLVHCAAVYAADERLSGTPVPLEDALRVGFSRFWPFLGLSALLSLLIACGTLLLIFPGLFAGVVFSLAIPLLVLRRVGIWDSLGMSWKMTKGHRLEILGLLLVYGLAILLVAVAVILPAILVLHLVGLDDTIAQTAALLVIDAFLTGAVLVAGGAIWTVAFRFIEAEATVVA